jgi:ligand-binding sensor domain-containing protein
MINNRENLVDYEETTDYSTIQQMQKDFKCYYDLWTVLETWKTSHKSWLNDSFDEIDAGSVEEIVDNSNKLMSQVIRFFRDKELPDILKIAETTKSDVEEFKP